MPENPLFGSLEDKGVYIEQEDNKAYIKNHS